jgi:hypothetical protein
MAEEIDEVADAKLVEALAFAMLAGKATDNELKEATGATDNDLDRLYKTAELCYVRGKNEPEQGQDVNASIRSWVQFIYR